MTNEGFAMTTDPNETLDKVLALLGVTDDAPTHHLSNLLRAIHAHAVSTGNEGIAYASEARLHLGNAEAENGSA